MYAVRASGYELLVCWFLVSVHCFLNLPVLFMYEAKAVMRSVSIMISLRFRWLLVIFLSHCTLNIHNVRFGDRACSGHVNHPPSEC